MKLKDSIFYKYEKTYVTEVISNGKRLDGRAADEYRKLDIQFGKEWGVCFVTLGETKVMSQVTCEVQQPKTVRPNEGLLFLNVEISPMAAPNIEQSTLSELHVHLSRLLEKCIKESHCVDLESLCIVAEEKVWCIRVDVVVLNYDGNMVGCSSIAALAALAHFRRPDVTIDGEEFIIHTLAEKDPIPLSIRHFPIAVCYAIFENGHRILSDPTDIEERTAEAELMLGMNSFRELCGMYLSGAVLQELNVLLKCSQEAATTASRIVKQVKAAIELDSKRRQEKTISCLVENIDVNRQLPVSQSRSFIVAKEIVSEDLTNRLNDVNIVEDYTFEIVQTGVKSAETVDKNKSTKSTVNKNKAKAKKRKRNKKAKANASKSDPWLIIDSSDDDVIEIIDETENSKIQKKEEPVTSSDDDVACVGEITSEDRIIEHIELSGDSEEENVVTMMPSDIENVAKSVTKGNIKNETD